MPTARRRASAPSSPRRWSSPASIMRPSSPSTARRPRPSRPRQGDLRRGPGAWRALPHRLPHRPAGGDRRGAGDAGQLDVYVRDRAPSVRFTGDSFVLPATARRGIPLVTVNMDEAASGSTGSATARSPSCLSGYQFLRQLDSYEIGNVADQLGEPVWEGRLAIAGTLNQEVTTSFPVDEALPERKPGVYLLTAAPGRRPPRGVGDARHAMVRRLRRRPLDLCRRGRAQRLRPRAVLGQAAAPAWRSRWSPGTTRCSAPPPPTPMAAPPSRPA